MNDDDPKSYPQSYPQSFPQPADVGETPPQLFEVIHNFTSRANTANHVLLATLNAARGRPAEAAWCYGAYVDGAVDCYVMAYEDRERQAIRLYSRCSRDHDWLDDLARAASLCGLETVRESVRDGRHDLLVFAE